VEYVKNIGIGGPRSSWRVWLPFVIPPAHFPLTFPPRKVLSNLFFQQ